ncbi:hypothetical protein JOF56_001994 [Kibdelosporangium banguiense]|uniref:Excalibur calcium-binding domain-containing protein n=1 Tax=Kibdelosporangium banguiense TaxID=1365924 RepID=A0ABS4TCD0_9PSEU|nr:excalibur calcium-binding domain-containing protein [Kibdelosporangium banguiense]MBP2321609.1 hypothetical protein [Kibdelosporangium banguiense]
MAGRQWHWIAAGVAVLAVFAAVLLNDTTSSNVIRAHPFATTDRTPEVGRPVLAVPTVDATTVTKTTQPVAPAPQVKQTSPPPAPPPPSTTPNTRTPGIPPRTTLSFVLPEIPEIPVFFPDCETAWFFGAAPMDEDEPGYRRELDRDHDGVACESTR